MRCIALVSMFGLLTAASPAPKVFRDCADCPEMTIVPAGSFRMDVPIERPTGTPGQAAPRARTVQRQVTIGHSFAIGVTEVTVAQYSAFIAATGHPDASRCFQFKTVEANGRAVFGWTDGASWRSSGKSQPDRMPVACMRWVDAQAYVAWLSQRTGHSYRLPSEREWEYAASGGGKPAKEQVICAIGNGADEALHRAYPGLASYEPCDDGAVFESPVRQYHANRFGLYDMKGNLWEWTADCDHVSYEGMPLTEVTWERDGECSLRVRRGGSWYRATGDDRSSIAILDAHGNSGIRVVREDVSQKRKR